MGQVVQFPTARARRQARATAAEPAHPVGYSGVWSTWLAMIEIHFRAWRSLGRSLAPSDEAADSRRETAGSK